MEAILKFQLPEDELEFNLATHGSDWYFVAWKMDSWLREKTKHAPVTMSDDEYNTYELCREKLMELIHENGVSLDY